MRYSPLSTTNLPVSSRGFTLVETLIAIAILMIAIAGPLVIATKGLTSALYSKDQMIASFMAQETMEVIKNTHDNNIAASPQSWLYGFSNCSSTSVCDVDGINDGHNFYQCPTELGCRVYMNPSTGYNTMGQGTPTQFFRHFYLDDVTTVSNAPQTDVHVIVDWYEGAIPFQIHLVSTITSATR